MNDTRWFVAHARPRCEKKVADYCRGREITVTLPCYKSVRKYRGKSVTFHKPLFPGYVFLQLLPGQVNLARQCEYVANLIEVYDQGLFEGQLKDILLALETGIGVSLAPVIEAGSRVRIKAGPLQGIEGWVETRSGLTTVFLRLDFINQAAAVKLDADLLEMV